MDSTRARSAATVERAADVLLQFVTARTRTLGVTQIANELAMSKAAVHRVLVALRSRGLIQFDESTHRYSLGPTAMALGSRYLTGLSVRRLAIPELRNLVALTNETATVSVRIGDSRVYVDQAMPARDVFLTVTIGVQFPLYAGASSKALLAFLPEDEIDSYLAGRLAHLATSAASQNERLRADLAQIRSQGWAHSVGERQAGAASVAAPVCDQNESPVAVISVAGPVERFGQVSDECVRQLLAAAKRMSAKVCEAARAE